MSKTSTTMPRKGGGRKGRSAKAEASASLNSTRGLAVGRPSLHPVAGLALFWVPAAP